MKILIDLTSLADNFSGIERYAACLAREMLKEKQDNEYILLFKNEIHSMFYENVKDPNVEIVVIPKCRKLLFNQFRLPLEIYKHKADCYLFLAFPVPFFLFKKNMVSTIHDICCWDYPETMNHLSNWYFRISHRMAVLKCKKLITISQFSKNRIVDRLKVEREKIWLIYCGIDDNFLNYNRREVSLSEVKEKYNLPANYLLSLSTLEPRKNLRLLIEAYRELVMNEDFEIPLVLAGRRGWKMDELLDGIEECVRNKILFTGFIADDDLPVIYGDSSLFIFPSMYEGFGMPPLEAISCGASVLSSDASSLPEVLGNAASYFKSNDKTDLIKNLKKDINSERNQDSFVSQTLKFSWKTEASKLLSFLIER